MSKKLVQSENGKVVVFDEDLVTEIIRCVQGGDAMSGRFTTEVLYRQIVLKQPMTREDALEWSHIDHKYVDDSRGMFFLAVYGHESVTVNGGSLGAPSQGELLRVDEVSPCFAKEFFLRNAPAEETFSERSTALYRRFFGEPDVLVKFLPSAENKVDADRRELERILKDHPELKSELA